MTLDDIKLYQFLMEIKQRFGGGTITKLKFKDKPCPTEK